MSDALTHPIRQLVYHSHSANSGHELKQDLSDILAESRTNNGIDGITGLLLAGGGKYIQVLEGSPESVEHLWARIQVDRRHSDLMLVQDHAVESRAFGGWTMANVDQDDREQLAIRLRRFLIRASKPIRYAFEQIV
jgi:hypothetical protein